MEQSVKGESADKILLIFGWVFVVLGFLVLLALIFPASGERTSVVLPILVFLCLLIWGIRSFTIRNSSKLSAIEKLSSIGATVCGFSCGLFFILAFFLIFTIFDSTEHAPGPAYALAAISVLDVLLYLIAALNFRRASLSRASVYMIVTGILSLPIGLPAMALGIAIKNVVKS